ncbi:hypothetical protein HY346_02195 [Candidatus Microgenomates bacterium]|nr:hypothetical protein [Candidatus Microgenomates bacterium]
MDEGINTPPVEAAPPAPAIESTPEGSGGPEQAPPTPEKAVERAPERAETSPQAGQAVVLPPVVPPVMADDQTTDGQARDDDAKSDMPLVAEDVDVIEMEWVNKAKKIINETKDDPHTQEKEVERLQREYLKKRYGKEIKASG